jgi:hypothetical protein
MAPAAAPKPIDPRGPRFNQAVITVLLLAGFVADWRVLVPAVAVVVGSGAAFGPRWNPFLALYGEVLRPRLRPPAELEDPRPPRFAAAMGAAVLALATLVFVLGNVILGWVLALLVAVMAGLAASSGICIGCEIYLFLARRRGIPAAS